ncbi:MULTISPECIES: transcriptional regulator [unclassified Brevibacterium]|uniref:transcriptional regulator n=1 Tax=unclassified Brevibacterium TaxID=2614124 RepID=UPI000C522DC5|nr:MULTISPECIES: transcriptional regulator [unclassified Brevibacterium]SMX91690.1 hypothetical protein BSP239C_02311 [Brevibacterium sp. 239c]
MSHRSEPQLLVLHAVRLLGFAGEDAVARRAGVGAEETLVRLHQAERSSWVQHLELFGVNGWSLTDFGRWENERQLAHERRIADPGNEIAAIYREFLPLNARMLSATTDWQIRPRPDDAFASNDHSDTDWDARVLDEVEALGVELAPVVERLTNILTRFEGILNRYEAALSRAEDGQTEWIDRTDVDSCHLVWFQLHEDLIATLGIDRGTEV